MTQTPLLRSTLYLLLVAVLGACAVSQNIDDANPVVVAYVNAFNSGDLSAMQALMAEDIQWLSVEASEVSMVTNGKAALVEELTGYLTHPDRPRSSMSQWSQNGPFVSVVETASWTDAQGQAKSQASLAVYEVRDEQIVRVWYYPAVKPQGN